MRWFRLYKNVVSKRVELQGLDKQLQAVSARCRRRDKHLEDEEQLQRQLAEARDLVKEWDGTVAETAKKLNKLDQASLAYLFGTLFGDRLDRISDEKERLLKQKLKRDESAAALAPLEQDLKAVRKALASFADVDATRAELLNQKEQLLKSRDDDVARELIESGERLSALRVLERELPEAIEAGQAVVPHLQAALVDLKGAQSWGAFDLLGGGLLVGMAKHGGIDAARCHIQDAQVCLRRFDRELRDVTTVSVDLNLDITAFDTFADIFFDCLISDWFAQTKINKSLGRVEAGLREVQSVTEQLRQHAARNAAELVALRGEREQLIEGL